MTRRRAFAALFLVVAVALLWWRGGRDHGTPAHASRFPSASTGVPSVATSPATMRAVTTDEQPSVARLKQEYEAYRAASVYPHWSIPLTPDMDFALRWNDAVTEDLALDGDGAFVRFDGSAGRVFAGEPYTAWLSAWRNVDGQKRALPVHVTRAAVTLTSGSAIGEAFEVAFHDDGKDGDKQARDGIVTTRFVPSERSELSLASTARIDAYVEIDGTPRHLVRDFVFAPRSVIDVRGAHDALRDGSLVVTLDCDVLEAGVYTFYANLVAADGRPIAMTKLSFPLAAGTRAVDLTFFGKVIHDRGIDGPYVVRDIHGIKRGEADEADVWWRHAPAHRTARYRAADLSNDEWNDDERTERLDNFERVIRELEAAQPMTN